MSDEQGLKRTVRLAQTVNPFGVGAVYDFRGESFVACDTTMWDHGVDLPAERLAEELGVAGFQTAPVVPPFGTPRRTPYARFPQWLFCGSCRQMTYVRREDEVLDQAQACRTCHRNPQLIPMRFVLVCAAGHLGDVPWPYWAHSQGDGPNQLQCGSRNLSFDVHRRKGVGLDALSVRCLTCSAVRSLRGITADATVKSLGLRCPGRQPWQPPTNAVDCDETPKVLQRGASNLYFASVASALDIPPESRRAATPDLSSAIKKHETFDIVYSSPTGPIAERLRRAIADELGCQVRDVERAIEGETRSRAGLLPEVMSEPQDRQTAEWDALQEPEPEDDHGQTFATRRVSVYPEKPTGEFDRVLAPYVDDVVLVTRLREVRALTAFRRYDLEEGVDVAPDLGAGLDWLPAVEVFGEGIFVRLNEEAVQAWETNPAVAPRVELLRERHAHSFLKGRIDHVSSRFVMIHTLAHLLLRRIAFEAGYPAASLRERLYAKTPDEVGGPQAGLLIYTAAGDYDGTLGGLVRMGEPPLLAASILAALESAMWCSADPICIESSGQGYGALNLAACHACALLAETSCTHWNLLLDRALVVGDQHAEGFLQQVIATESSKKD